MKTKMMALLVALLLMSVSAFGATVKLAWDPNDPTPEGYRVFDRENQSVYDYSNPVWQGSETFCTLSNLLGHPMVVTRYYFVVRAYEGALESADSIEVYWDLDRTPPVQITSIQAGYDRAAGAINLSFVQPNPERAKYWKVYYTFTSNQDYVEFDTIQNTGQAEPTTTKAFDAVKEGERKTVYFAVVGFFDDESYSSNSMEAAVDVNRVILQPPANVTIEVLIPVQ